MKKSLLATVAIAAMITGASLAQAEDMKGSGAGASAPHADIQKGSAAGQRGAAGAATHKAPSTTGAGSEADTKTGGSAEMRSDTKSGVNSDRAQNSTEMKAGAGAESKSPAASKSSAEKATTEKSAAEKSEKSATEKSAADHKSSASERSAADEKSGTARSNAERSNSTASERATGAKGGTSVSLTTEQRTKIRTSVLESRSAPKLSRSEINFNISVGTVVPRSVHFVAVPDTLIEIHPQWRGYRYFVVDDQIVIIEPDTLKIVDVIVV